MARQAGLDYFPMSTDMAEDEKIYGIMAEVSGDRPRSDKAWAARGRIDQLLSEIFSQGFALELTTAKTILVAEKLGMRRPAELDAFIGVCVRHGFFDAGLWESCRVLTSCGIQKRYAAATKRSVRSLVGPYVLEPEGIIPEIARNEPKSPEIDRNRPKSPAEEKEKEKEEWKEEERTASPSGGMAEALPCLSVPAADSSVFIDLAKGPHQTALGSIAASYAAVTGADPAPFVCGLAGRCPPSCRGGPKRADECYQLVMKALGKFDPAKGRDPWPLVKTILDQERGSR